MALQQIIGFTNYWYNKQQRTNSRIIYSTPQPNKFLKLTIVGFQMKQV